MLEIDECPFRPEPPRELLAGDDVTGVLEHHAEDLERLLLETDAVLPFPQLAGADVELEGFETE